MLSRVAGASYWMSRYVERAENTARFVEVAFSIMLDLGDRSQNQWSPLVSTSGDSEYFEEHYGGEANPRNVIEFLMFDTDYPNSVISSLKFARENARSIRESLPSLAWEQLNQFYQRMKSHASNPDGLIQDPLEFLTDIKLASHTFKGILDSAMSHSEGWHFVQLGRYLERADKTTRMLDVQYYRLLPSVYHVGTPIDDLQWSALLKSVSGFEMYRRAYHQITPERVIEFLILDRDFPRSLLHCIESANLSLHAISGSTLNSFVNSAEQLLGRLQADLSFLRVEDIVNSGLHEFIDSIQTKVNNIDHAIHTNFIDKSFDDSRSAHLSSN